MRLPAILLLSGPISLLPKNAASAELPDILPAFSELLELAYPTWCIDDDETRITNVDTCAADSSPNGKWSPLYLTKQFSGADPSLGGYPTPLDIQYAFEYASPYLGQPCAGSPHHCPEDFDGSSKNCKECPTLTTSDDNGPYGPGHVPPHISLAAVTKAYNEKSAGDVEEWFNYDQNACRILPNHLLKIVRMYYPRGVDGMTYYPPPYSVAGGSYPFEFANLAGESCDKAAAKHSIAAEELDCIEAHSGVGSTVVVPDSLEVGYGSPHYCSKESAAAGVASDYCPYITWGPNRGKYRHPHLAYSAVETYLANKVMPDLCGTEWDDSNYPPKADNTQAFPEMTAVDSDLRLVDHDQPTIKDGLWIWPGPEGTMKKAVVGNFANHLCVVEGYESTPSVGTGTNNDELANRNVGLNGAHGIHTGKAIQYALFASVLGLSLMFV